ncbi:MAG: L-fucokinase [Phycisphaerae bacterium]
MATADKTNSLQALMARAAETYKRALIGHQPGLVWDYVVLTAANEHQAAGYRHEMEFRSASSGPLGAFFPPSQKTLVVPDPPGFRAGSGGATFGVLRAIASHQKSIGDRKPFEALRILLIHSGGASQRLPLYSPLGKIFAPLPMIRPDGAITTLFDHLYLMLAGLPSRLGPGMLVCAGDVFLLFDAQNVTPPQEGITALSMRVPVELGEAHGVFKVDPKDSSVMPRVLACMQKATAEQMKSAGVTDAKGQVLIDSGLLFFDSSATTRLYELSRKYTPAWHIKNRRQIDLYVDVVPAALKENKPALAEEPVLRKLQLDLREKLAESPLRCLELSFAHFLHLGTTKQFRDAMVGADPAPAAVLFQQNVRVASEAALPKSARVYQSVIGSKEVKIEEQVVIENCRLSGMLTVGRGSVLSGLSMEAKTPQKIAPDTLIFEVPVKAGGKTVAVTVIAGVHDDFKTDRTFCNIDLRHWLMLTNLSDADLWGKDKSPKRALWTAKLFRAGPLALPDLLWMSDPKSLTAQQRTAWRKAKRYSMADILESADAAAMAAHRDAISGLLQATQWIAAVEAGSPASVQNTINHFGPAGYQNLTQEMLAEVTNDKIPPLLRARLNWTLAEVQLRPGFPREAIKCPVPIATLQKQAFGLIREAMAEHYLLQAKPTRIKDHEPGLLLTACSPVRLDLAGGWTDTPPHCLEFGGTVVNVAVNLNEVEPIQSPLRMLDEPVVRLVSRDLGKTLVVHDPQIFRKPVEPGDPFSLQIVALQLTGLAPTDKETTQGKWLSRLTKSGKGFELTTASNLPKGSGMGTSSILGATTLAVLRAAIRQDTKPATLFEQTLLLEQHLGTGGGWQDQAGGIVGGVKFTETKPGIPQVLRVRQIPLNKAQLKGLEDRLVVYFTGQQRLARNILREVMGRYLSREPGTMLLFHELTQAARALEQCLRNSDWMGCATEINRYWRIKRDLFAGSSTSAIDAMFLELRPYYLGAGLAGAGGGGFAYFLCADADQAHRLRTELHRISTRPGSLGLTFSATLNMQGLRISRQMGVA